MIKYSDLERYIVDNNINRERSLFDIIEEFIESYNKPQTKQSNIPIVVNNNTEFTFEQVVELLSQ